MTDSLIEKLIAAGPEHMDSDHAKEMLAIIRTHLTDPATVEAVAEVIHQEWWQSQTTIQDVAKAALAVLGEKS